MINFHDFKLKKALKSYETIIMKLQTAFKSIILLFCLHRKYFTCKIAAHTHNNYYLIN